MEESISGRILGTFEYMESASPMSLPLPKISVRLGFFLLALASFGSVAGALVLGDIIKLPQPCHLCILLRLIYLVYGVWALFGLAVPGWRRFWSFCLAVTAVGGIAAAAEQSWMEYAPHLVTECGFGDPTLSEQLVNWLGMKWPSMFMVTGFCTQQDWHFLGLSLANWSVLFFLGLLVAALALFFRKEK